MLDQVGTFLIRLGLLYSQDCSLAFSEFIECKVSTEICCIIAFPYISLHYEACNFSSQVWKVVNAPRFALPYIPLPPPPSAQSLSHHGLIQVSPPATDYCNFILFVSYFQSEYFLYHHFHFHHWLSLALVHYLHWKPLTYHHVRGEEGKPSGDISFYNLPIHSLAPLLVILLEFAFAEKEANILGLVPSPKSLRCRSGFSNQLGIITNPRECRKRTFGGATTGYFGASLSAALSITIPIPELDTEAAFFMPFSYSISEAINLTALGARELQARNIEQRGTIYTKLEGVGRAA